MTSLSDEQLERLRSLVDWPDVTDTRYELREKIAVGGMGSVYKAHDRVLDRPVAFKVLTVTDPTGELASRMMNEAKTVARLEHPSIVPIHDVGRLADGRVYYAMKFVEGRTLEAYRINTPLPVLLRVFQKICDGVEFAHSRSVVHRDLKPANVMVGSFGEVLVMDWGVAADTRVRSEVDDSLIRESPSRTTGSSGNDPRAHTVPGAIIGTPAYMSPEAALGKSSESDFRTDIYGLGAILYFLLTGHAPWAGTARDSEFGNVTSTSITAVRERNPAIARRLAAICEKAMSHSPDDRYQSAQTLSADISRYLDQEPVSAYRENLFEKIARWLGRNRFIVWMVMAYIVFRFLIFFWRGL